MSEQLSIDQVVERQFQTDVFRNVSILEQIRDQFVTATPGIDYSLAALKTVKYFAFPSAACMNKGASLKAAVITMVIGVHDFASVIPPDLITEVGLAYFMRFCGSTQGRLSLGLQLLGRIQSYEGIRKFCPELGEPIQYNWAHFDNILTFYNEESLNDPSKIESWSDLLASPGSGLTDNAENRRRAIETAKKLYKYGEANGEEAAQDEMYEMLLGLRPPTTVNPTAIMREEKSGENEELLMLCKRILSLPDIVAFGTILSYAYARMVSKSNQHIINYLARLDEIGPRYQLHIPHGFVIKGAVLSVETLRQVANKFASTIAVFCRIVEVLDTWNDKQGIEYSPIQFIQVKALVILRLQFTGMQLLSIGVGAALRLKISPERLCAYTSLPQTERSIRILIRFLGKLQSQISDYPTSSRQEDMKIDILGWPKYSRLLSPNFFPELSIRNNLEMTFLWLSIQNLAVRKTTPIEEIKHAFVPFKDLNDDVAEIFFELAGLVVDNVIGTVQTLYSTAASTPFFAQLQERMKSKASASQALVLSSRIPMVRTKTVVNKRETESEAESSDNETDELSQFGKTGGFR